MSSLPCTGISLKHIRSPPNNILFLVCSVIRWLDIFSPFCHLQAWKFDQSAQNLCHRRLNILPNTKWTLKNCQRLYKILPILVTLPSCHGSFSLSHSFNNFLYLSLWLFPSLTFRSFLFSQWRCWSNFVRSLPIVWGEQVVLTGSRCHQQK